MVTLRWFYALLQIIGVIILTGEILYVSFQRSSNLQKIFLIVLFTILISEVGYFIELIATNYQTAYIGCCLGYLGKPFALMSSLILLLEYSNIKIHKSIVIAITVYFIFLTATVITNDYHHLYYTSVSFSTTKVGSPLEIEGHGIFWYAYMISSFLFFVAFSIITLYEYKTSKTKQAKQMAILLFFVIFCTFLGLFLYLFKLTYNYDSTLAGILIASLLLLVLFSKYRIFSSITEGKHKLLNESKDGAIVVDARMKISYYNDTASKLFPSLKKSITAKAEQQVLEYLSKFSNGQSLHFEDKVYSIVIKDNLIGKQSRFVGKTFIFNDITEHYNYQETLNNEIDKTVKKLKGVQRNVLISFADIVEARDTNTGEHIKNVSTTAVLICNALKKNSMYSHSITNEFKSILCECAPLHDIGKIYISDSILNKPRKLTPEEFEIMKTHTTKGYELIQNSVKDIEEPIYVKIAGEIALSHHERWDGTGYPNQLKGQKIPLSARILAVADVYDALRMKRPYKEEFSKEKSIQIIKEESGTHFDPEIVKAFLSITDKLK